MSNFINLKKFTANTLVGVALTGALISQSSLNTANAQIIDNNNGHGNNCDINITIGSRQYTIEKFDPSNPGNGDKLTKILKKAGLTKPSDISTAIEMINKGNYDYKKDESCSLSADIVVTIELPKTQTSQLSSNNYYVVDFNSLSGTAGFSKTNGTTTYQYNGGLEIKTRDQWGGANGSKYITQASGQRSYSLTVNQDQRYFGFWWSAGDAYNKITFKNDGKEVAVFKTEDLVNFINSSGVKDTQAYYGNPNGGYGNNGHLKEPFSFVNLFFNDKAYDEIVVETLTGSGAKFESDNHTFSANKQLMRGIVIPDTNLDLDPNNPPGIVDDSAETIMNNSVLIDVLANDSDSDGDILNIQNGKVTTPINGTAVVENHDGIKKIRYTPNANFYGDDSFEYTAVDPKDGIGTATVNIKVIPTD
ncbi:cadherin-like domain-containing protein [Myxosarcina sp. GI1]|uniref:cadherin-like domain-containing protein n=1 Tax=Myxosarcina sp. GI1 TaxID=1541065 RepID=UPI00055D246E|nr:cadherin-like domain-containing protein [Myxosarcina sp. GI1]